MVNLSCMTCGSMSTLLTTDLKQNRSKKSDLSNPSDSKIKDSKIQNLKLSKGMKQILF